MFIINLIIKIISVVSKAITYITKYKVVYKILGFFTTRTFKKAQKNHKYAVLVAARNEETVIGNLVESIRKQDYPKELVTIFVVADNCTDNTAAAARKNGAICYERQDNEHRTKGFALQFLVECIRRDYGIESFEGYFIFDADNLLAKDYISKMNESFDSGEKIITSYRNTKNFADNWISASYGIHWLRTIRNEHRPRSVLRLATRIQGTGFLFASEVIKDGWNYTSLTEDRAFCADAVVNGYKISYNNDAQFYDEQPVDIKIAFRQRIRWAKGHLQAFVESGGMLFVHIFRTFGKADNTLTEEQKKELTPFKIFVNNVRFRFMSLDMLSVIYPRTLVSVFKKIILLLLKIAKVLLGEVVILSAIAPKTLKIIFGLSEKELNSNTAILLLTAFTLYWTFEAYIKNIICAVYIYIMERKRIGYIKWYKKVWYCLTFPIFDIIGKISLVIALFTKVEWKPIPHNSNISISQLNNEKDKTRIR